MKRMTLAAAVCTCLLQLTGCKKFFDVRPNTSEVNPVAISDFKEMLNSDSTALGNYMLSDFMSDDIRIEDAHQVADARSAYIRSYLWSEIIWQPGSQDHTYNSTYSNILQMNIIIDRIDRAKGPDSEKDLVRAQAQINRASYYLQLANIYGMDYRASNAATDLAVPLVTMVDPGQLPSRATVQQVYDFILQDLNAAVSTSSLPGMGQDIIHPGKAAGYALLARAYLYMGKYDEALSAANAALNINSRLLKYTKDYIPPSVLLDLAQNPEILLGRMCIDYDFFNIRHVPFFIGPSLRSFFSSDDVRFTNNFVNGLYVPGDVNSSIAFDYSVRVPEVMLIKAECLARQQRTADALALVNEIRKNRLLNYQPLDPSTDAMTAVLSERRRELFCHGGLRLFDIKRLNRDPQFAQTLQRKADNGTDVIATLPVGSPRYLMPFSPFVIDNNPAIIQNPR